jgi:hypothetical protein
MVDSDVYRFGIHATPSKRSELLGSFIYLDQDMAIGEDHDAPPDHIADNGYIAEAQYLYRHAVFAAILGGGYYQLDEELDSDSSTTKHGNAYLYSYIRFPASISWTLGVSIDAFEDVEVSDNEQSDITIHPINPKFGVLWTVTADTVFRAAIFKTFKRSLFANQTLEPTQVAGFNQFFDDPNLTESIRWGVGIDHRFSRVLAGGAEVSKRELDIPIRISEGRMIGKNLFIASICIGHRIRTGLRPSNTSKRTLTIWNPPALATRRPKLSP